MWNTPEREETQGRLSRAQTKLLLRGLEATALDLSVLNDREPLETRYDCLNALTRGTQFAAIRHAVCGAIDPAVPIDMTAPAWKEAALAHALNAIVSQASSDAEMEGSFASRGKDIEGWFDYEVFQLCKELLPDLMEEYEIAPGDEHTVFLGSKGDRLEEDLHSLFLWDDDFAMEDAFRGAPAAQKAGVQKLMGVAPGYYDQTAADVLDTDDQMVARWFPCYAGGELLSNSPLAFFGLSKHTADPKILRSSAAVSAVIAAANTGEPFRASRSELLTLRQTKLIESFCIPLADEVNGVRLKWKQLRDSDFVA